MRYVLKERIFSLRDSFYITEQGGAKVYEVTGALISIGDRLTFRDMNGNTLATIRERKISLRDTYAIYENGELRAEVIKDLINVLRQGFSVKMAGDEPDLRIKGNILEHNYKIRRGDVQIAEVSKAWVSVRDSYGVDIAAGEDPVLILACAVIVDRIAHEDED